MASERQFLHYVSHPIGEPGETFAGVRRWQAWLSGTLPGNQFTAPYLSDLRLWMDPEWAYMHGMVLGQDEVAICDVLVLVGGRITPTMRRDIALAESLNIEVVDFTEVGVDPPDPPDFETYHPAAWRTQQHHLS
jgi:hypothetical protein